MIRVINIELPTPTPDGLSHTACISLSVVFGKMNGKDYPP